MKRKQRFFKLSALVGCILLGVGIVMGSAGFVAMGCDLDAFTYPRGGEPVAVSSFVVEDAVDSIETVSYTHLAATLNGYCEKGKDIRVILKGGELKIHYTDERVLMTGKAEKVYDGVVEV